MNAVEFRVDWYTRFIQSTNEKDLLVTKISDILEGKAKSSCLEIGLGISPYFAEQLSPRFQSYTIVEKRHFGDKLPLGVQLVTGDWEKISLSSRFDVIIASHVVYYFRDKEKAVRQMFDRLNDEGRIIFVVNGKSADYGPLKLAFAKIISTDYNFTYDQLMSLLQGRRLREYTFPSVIRFSSFEDLFEILRLSFDSYPREYESSKEEIMRYFRSNIKGSQFIIEQKIIEAVK